MISTKISVWKNLKKQQNRANINHPANLINKQKRLPDKVSSLFIIN